MKRARINRRLMISKNLIMMLVVLVVGLLAVWSWFTVNKEVEANTIKVSAAYPNEVSLAKVIKYYDSNGNLVNEGPDIFEGEINFSADSFKFTKDCTGDGLTLLVPDFSVIKDKNEATKKGRVVNSNGVWEEALSQNEVELIKAYNPDSDAEARYMEFEFYARATGKSINVCAGSCLKSETEEGGNSLSTPISDTNNPKKSAYGNFNVDGLVGAIRVALVAEHVTNVTQNIEVQNVGGTPTPRIVEPSSGYGTTANFGTSYTQGGVAKTMAPELGMLWLPRPDVKLQVSNTGLTTDWTLSNAVDAGVTDIHKYFAPASDTFSTTYYDYKQNNVAKTGNNGIAKKTGTGLIEKTGGEKVVVSSNINPNSYATLGTDFDATNLSYRDFYTTSQLRRDPSQPTNANYYVFKYKLRIWIEGEDTEARRAMDGGAFNLHFELK